GFASMSCVMVVISISISSSSRSRHFYAARTDLLRFRNAHGEYAVLVLGLRLATLQAGRQTSHPAKPTVDPLAAMERRVLLRRIGRAHATDRDGIVAHLYLELRRIDPRKLRFENHLFARIEDVQGRIHAPERALDRGEHALELVL